MKKLLTPLRIIFIILFGVVINTRQVFADCSSDACGTVVYSGAEATYYCAIEGGQCRQGVEYCTKKNPGEPCCVGSNRKSSCVAHRPSPTPTPTPRVFSPYEVPSNKFFNMLNPLQHAGGENIFEEKASAYADTLSTPGGIVSRLLSFAFPLAGLILFVMLVWGGFEILIQAPSKKAIDAGRQRVTAALIGFMLLFASYWIWQIVEVIFGVVIF